MAASRTSLPAGLLADVKAYLNVTWSDDATETKLKGIIASGMAYLDGKRGAPASYTADGEPRTLLLEYCRYARDSALEVFENNYRDRILAMQNERRVTAYSVEKAFSTPCG